MKRSDRSFSQQTGYWSLVMISLLSSSISSYISVTDNDEASWLFESFAIAPRQRRYPIHDSHDVKPFPRTSLRAPADTSALPGHDKLPLDFGTTTLVGVHCLTPVEANRRPKEAKFRDSKHASGFLGFAVLAPSTSEPSDNLIPPQSFPRHQGAR